MEIDRQYQPPYRSVDRGKGAEGCVGTGPIQNGRKSESLCGIESKEM